MFHIKKAHVHRPPTFHATAKTAATSHPHLFFDAPSHSVDFSSRLPIDSTVGRQNDGGGACHREQPGRVDGRRGRRRHQDGPVVHCRGQGTGRVSRRGNEAIVAPNAWRNIQSSQIKAIITRKIAKYSNHLTIHHARQTLSVWFF